MKGGVCMFTIIFILDLCIVFVSMIYSFHSLFDDPEARYKKLKRTANSFLISQFGMFDLTTDLQLY